jgi:hypothetical protein
MALHVPLSLTGQGHHTIEVLMAEPNKFSWARKKVVQSKQNSDRVISDPFLSQ